MMEAATEAIQAPEGGSGMSDQLTHLWRECWQPCMPTATCFGVSKLLQVRRGRITATGDEYGLPPFYFELRGPDLRTATSA
ncbi:hypothetical protein ACVWW4_003867 [Bradyrhizobium sp. LB7.1]